MTGPVAVCLEWALSRAGLGQALVRSLVLGRRHLQVDQVPVESTLDPVVQVVAAAHLKELAQTDAAHFLEEAAVCYLVNFDLILDLVTAH